VGERNIYTGQLRSGGELLEFIWIVPLNPDEEILNKSQKTCVPEWALMFKPMSRGGRYNIN
jgi:hypothetical protein